MDLCVGPSCTDKIQNGDETGVDCGGSCTTKCDTGQGCKSNADCTNQICDVGNTNLCIAPTSTDGVQNGTETDVDCGGGAPTNAPKCLLGKKCGTADTNCTTGACNYAGVCVEFASCKVQYGGDTCGAKGAPESCCKTLPAAGLPAGTVATSTIDKYNITAGRMRAFATAVNGDMRGWINAHKPTWWVDAWSNGLPTKMDDGTAGPTCCVSGDPNCTAGQVGQACGFYQEVGPYVHGAGAAGANEGCYIRGYGARTYRVPDATNVIMNDMQRYSQQEEDQRSMNCVTAYILAAFCAWDGGHMPTRQQIDYVWGTHKYPWGSDAALAAATGGSPLGYAVAYDVDPQGGMPGTQPAFGKAAYGSYVSSPYATLPLTANQLVDLQYANYNFNYWGGLTQLYVGYCSGTGTVCADGDACAGAPGNKCPVTGGDQTLFIAPPGRFPNGNGPYGHADIGGNVFNITDMDSNSAYWSLSGSWQGHPLPWPTSGGTHDPNTASRVHVASYYKYWAMGGRCAR
jgi:hypothetical protein